MAAQVARERLTKVRPTTLDEVPPSADALTDTWLTAALCREVPGAHVVGHELVGGSDGTSSRRALRVRYDAAGQEAGLPTALFTKSAATLQSRLLLVLSGVTQGETTFYRDLRPQLPRLRSPRAFHAASDERTGRSIVVLEDLAAGGWSFPDPMADTVSRRDAEDMVDEMAYYHATFWGRPPTGLATTLEMQERLNALGMYRRAEIGIERSREVMPPAVYARKAQLLPTTMRALALNGTGTPTVLHQDVHQGNWLRDPGGRMGLYDWQATARGEWALDVAYALCVNLPVDDRRAWERELLERYLQRLGDEGVSAPPTFDEAWLRVRQQPFHVLIFALFTIGAGRLQPDMQPKDYMLRCLRRITAAIDDWGSLDSLA
ncbi:phosphotransferase [Conexibacter sp. SYSU D00693]|uniref:phosphotransferase n=1 Tax=Conexibacter sp. SYSU D00693 TaxID=2812560 RepID=UPI00196A5611|nr:phosphotransferase [Conexibacter sp. SYSU D00693]